MHSARYCVGTPLSDKYIESNHQRSDIEKRTSGVTPKFTLKPLQVVQHPAYQFLVDPDSTLSSNVKTLPFSRKVAFRIRYAFRSAAREPSTDRFHLFPAAKLHIGKPISGFISICINCAMCRVFALWLPLTLTSDNQRCQCR